MRFFPSLAGQELTVVRWRSIMKVSAADKGTGKSSSVTIENERGRLSQEEIDRVSFLVLAALRVEYSR